MTPLAIMLALMREKWAQGDHDGAVKLAVLAAPYLHPRRASVADDEPLSVEAHRLSDADLCRRLARHDGGTEAETGDP